MNAEELRVINRLINWFGHQAAKNDMSAKYCKFKTLTSAYIADAKNYRAMAADLKKVAILTPEEGSVSTQYKITRVAAEWPQQKKE